MNIFVAKLSFKTDSETLKQAFEEFGEVSSSKVIMDRETNKSKGFGFVEMPDDNEAQDAINALDGTELNGHTIVVKKANPRESSNGGGNFNSRPQSFNRYE